MTTAQTTSTAAQLPDANIGVTSSGCWLWRGPRTKDGYGVLSSRGRMRYSHIHYYEAKNGRRAAGTVLDHLCRNRACCNPDHLEPVTGRENIMRGVGPTAINARKTHCVHGHLFDEGNTIVRKGGGRECRACREATRTTLATSQNGETVISSVTAKSGLDAKIRQAWKTMRQNCSNSNRPMYRYFGGKGIRVCDEWDKSFALFRDWSVAHGCSAALVLKRIDTAKDFAPDNCCWIGRNDPRYVTAAPRVVTAWGETKRVADWARDSRCSVSEQTIGYRLDRGWTGEAAISTPAGKKAMTEA